ncbi:MAG: proprotein convertase P-domain-containing protein [Bacteroidetes bacterium]|nr:proprotein convertase P-domain-containing protein [Bacteroidota bacterium]
MKSLYTLVIILLLAIPSQAQTFSWSGFAPIMDNQTDTIPIVVSGLPTVIDTSFGLAHICMNITHTYKADLLIQMVSPSGMSVTLIQSIGGSNDNFIGTCVGMDGTSFSNSTAPYSGIFVPVGDVSTFNNGQNPNGTWLFIVKDQANADTGSVHTASIEFTYNPPRSGSTGVGSGPTGLYLCPTCVCPGGATNCDLLPDMTSSAKEIIDHHNETPGALYISNATPNIGYGPIDIFGIDSCFCGTDHVPCGTVCPDGDEIKHMIKQRIYQKVPGNDTLSYYDRPAGAMTFHPDHGHLHVDHWANYTLRTATSNPDATTWPIVGTGVKQSFCLINLGTCSGNPGECLDNNGNIVTTTPNNNLGFHTGCGLNQGIYPGNYDVYSLSLNDPIPLVNVCNGTYYIVSITDPENNFLESDETNNWVAVPITLTQQGSSISITASGPTSICQGGSVTLTASTAANYLWSTGETTPSITVTTAGNYTVSTNCGSGVTTSQPITVTVNTVNMTVSATPSNSVCKGDAIQLNSSASSTGTQIVPVTFSTNQPVFIPDNNTTGVTSPIAVSGISPTTLSANVLISVNLNLTHTYDGDLAISLVAPSGNSIFLSNRRGGSGDNFINTTFSLSAIANISTGIAPFSNSYIPDGSFNSLTGNVNGTWLLKVQDLASIDTGRVQSWSITIKNVVPETFTYNWTSSTGVFTSSIQNPITSPSAGTTYTITATSSATNCTGSTTVNVSVPDSLSITSLSSASGVAGSTLTITGTGFTNINSVTIAGINAASFLIISPTQIQAVVPNASPQSGVVCVSRSLSCSACSATSFSIVNSINFNIHAFIQGFYKSSGTMRALLYDLNLHADPTACDSITIDLHSSNAPYPLLESSKILLHTNGSGAVSLKADDVNNSFYLVIRHRNALTTWSASPVTITSNGTYDFAINSNQAFGQNTFSLGGGAYGIYSGDVDQNGTIDSADHQLLESGTSLFLSGYTPADITGDGQVESADYSLIENNLQISVLHP